MNNENAKREKKREEIANAAFRLFMQKGYTNTKIIDIAAAMNIGKGTVYEYFKSKDDILLDIILNNVKGEFEKLSVRIAEHDAFEDRLRAMINFEIDFVQRFGKYAVEIKNLVFEASDTKLSEEIQKAIFDIIGMEHRAAYEMVELAMSRGEMRRMNKTLAAHFIVGMSATYASVKGGIPCELGIPHPSGIDEKMGDYTADDIVDLIKNGIGA